MRAFEDPKHEGNSKKYHTGKTCIEKGCDRPAGTWWSPSWCFAHNVARMTRIGDGLKDAAARAELHALIDKETETLRAWAYETSRTMKAMVFAAGGEVTITNADKDRVAKSESVNYGEHTTTYRYF